MAIEHRKVMPFVQLAVLKSVAHKLVQKEKWAEDMLKLCCALEMAENQIERQQKEIMQLQRQIRHRK
jgi:hypothetical protein